MITALLLATLAAAPTKYLLLPLQCTDGFTEKQCRALESAVAAELRRFPEVQLLTHDDVRSVLDNNAAQRVLGCSDPSCYADVSSAIGARFLVKGNYGALGESQIVSLSVIGTKPVRVASASSIRIRSTQIDDTLDALPKLGAAVMGQIGVADRTKNAMLRLPKPPKGRRAMPAGFKDTPLDTTLPAKMVFLKDDAGNILAYDVKEKARGVLLAGTTKALWKQRVAGSSSSGESKFSVSFWDPRFKQRSFQFKDGKYELICGKKSIPFSPLSEAEAKKLRGEARVFNPRWHRYPVVLARDNRGTYYFVDQVRNEDEITYEVEDYRLFVGRKGRVELLDLEDAIVDRAGQVFLTKRGRLVVEFNGKEKKVQWFIGDNVVELVDVELWSAAKMVYTRLGSYAGQPIGTACDPYL
ncbi:MAG: hypothetical protein AAF658_18185 [Myxococcota bacterium]